ncbi:hypothetical protein CDL12_06498 [Handroanthus impetiginosus]|uniref:DUF868 domain-containing protein n=1 Tax=Handroanthus impetiginosus TaxID=429701 RepID=A0A2G9HTM5_9LAMI|nr:hypothetical protein CDL12_06498 [Handroanthus impetiginosus]
MIDFASCFSEYAVQISNTSCSLSKNSCISPGFIPSTQNDVTCLYKAILSTQKQILITLTWRKNTALYQGLNIKFGDDPSNTLELSTNSRSSRKLKGSKSLEFDTSKFEVFWDLSSARYQPGPEPVGGFYLFIIVDSKLCLILGDMAQKALDKKLKDGIQTAIFSLVSRQEHFSGNALYLTTRAQFCGNKTSHDILIRCSGEKEGLEHQVLSVFVDKRVMIRVTNLQWNFRGNQTIFLDGLLVDLMWDVHDWFFNSYPGSAVFIFRTRSGLDGTRLWLEENDQVLKDHDKVDFTLMIYSCKTI